MKVEIELIPESDHENGIVSGWKVTIGERYCDGLGWDEMLGLMAATTLKPDSPIRSWLKTKEEHIKEAATREELYKKNAEENRYTDLLYGHSPMLLSQLIKAKRLIRQWHGMGAQAAANVGLSMNELEIWEIYEKHAPEMQSINALIKKLLPKGINEANYPNVP